MGFAPQSADWTQRILQSGTPIEAIEDVGKLPDDQGALSQTQNPPAPVHWVDVQCDQTSVQQFFQFYLETT